MDDELTTVRAQRDTLIFFLDRFFAAEQAKDRRGKEESLGMLLVTLGDIKRSDYPYQELMPDAS